jgi:predicted HTH transcriptional regulator
MWGRGTNKVISLCKQHGAQPPTVEERQGFLAVTFRAEMVAGGGPPREGGGLAEKVGSRLVEGLADSQRRILDLMRKNLSISKRQLAATIGISTTAADKNIASMKAKGLVRRVGSDKGRHWEVAG